MATKSTNNYQTLSQELDDIMAALQHEDTDVDEAVRLYERGAIVVHDLQTHLKTSENKVKKIKLKG